MTPLQIKLAIAAAAALAVAALYGWGLYWRGEYREVKAVNAVLVGQVAVLADGVRTCNAGVELAKRVGDQAIAVSGALLTEARKKTAPARHTVERIETIIERPAPAGAGCDTAWDAIEADRKARGP